MQSSILKIALHIYRDDDRRRADAPARLLTQDEHVEQRGATQS